MVAEGHTVASLTGGVEGSQRDAIIDSFRSGEAKVLITTNVLARGIDVSTVSLVVNYVGSNSSHETRKANFLPRIFPKSTPPANVHTPPTSRPTFTVLVVPVALAVSELPSRSFPTATSGRCSARFKHTSSAPLIVSTLATGMKWRISSKRRSKTLAPKPDSTSDFLRAGMIFTHQHCFLSQNLINHRRLPNNLMFHVHKSDDISSFFYESAGGKGGN